MTTEPTYVRAPAVPPSDADAEQLVLGAVLLSPRIVNVLVNELRLAPEHFSRERHRQVYEAMLAIDDRGGGIDAATVRYELEEQGIKRSDVGALIDLLAVAVPDVGNYRQYAKRVIRMAEWNSRLRRIYDQLDAIARMDENAYRDATARDELVSAGHDGLLTPEELASRWVDWYDRPESDSITTPWPRINDGLFGGLRPGDGTVIAGWPGEGKSVAGDQLVEHAKTEHGLTGCVYLNEMSHIDRVSRLLAGRAGASFKRIMRRELTPDEVKRALREAPKLPFAMQPCAGWSADAIARHIRHYRWGICFVDHATRIPARDVADWDHISRVLTDAARQSGTHLLAAVQLNRERSGSPERPMPVLRDLRNTSAWEQDFRNIVFVHRRDELDRDKGIVVTHDDGVLHLAKVNNGQPDAERVFLNYRRMRYEVLAGEAAERSSDPW